MKLLIHCCLRSSLKYFNYIHDENYNEYIMFLIRFHWNEDIYGKLYYNKKKSLQWIRLENFALQLVTSDHSLQTIAQQVLCNQSLTYQRCDILHTQNNLFPVLRECCVFYSSYKTSGSHFLEGLCYMYYTEESYFIPLGFGAIYNTKLEFNVKIINTQASCPVY